MGLTLKNPIIVGACKITAYLESLLKCEAAGAGAVVIHSLFEEQIAMEQLRKNSANPFKTRQANQTRITELYPEGLHGSAIGHIEFIRQVKKALNIPVIASLNATKTSSWVEYAKRMEDTGADALEMNLYYNPADPTLGAKDIEAEQIEHIQAVCQALEIPVSVKLSYFYTNLQNMIHRTDQAGAQGIILFNRLFAPEIDVNGLHHTQAPNFSVPGDQRLGERFIGMLYHKIKSDLCANTGLFTAEDIIKALLCGAQVVQLVSTLYKNHLQSITGLIHDMERWMDEQGFETLQSFRGKLSESRIADKFIYRRGQYIDTLVHSEEYNNDPLRSGDKKNDPQ